MNDLAFLSGHDLVVYSETACPDCRRFDQWAQQNGVKLRKVLISEDAGAAEKLERETGKMAVPFVLVDGQRWVRGYHKELPSRFSAELLATELRAAVEYGVR
ncbi:MAG: glutaredoxin family protein [Planctomycetes bacterium]|nr:glutaredoxin family protein [Planctomycetota bacterium]